MSSDGVEQLKGLNVTLSKSVGMSGDGPVHRHDESAACGNAPDHSSGVLTDLYTANVVGEKHLCPHCEWPDQAWEMLKLD